MARQSVREAAVTPGFGITDVTHIVTAASELTRNIYVYAGSGVMRWRSIVFENCIGLELTFADQGPGIADVEHAMEPGYSTGRGLGRRLPGAKRLVDEMDLYSEPGQGTTVCTRKWLLRR